MIIQPGKGTRNANDLFYKAEQKRIDMLNQEFFHNVQLGKKENDVLISVFRKIRKLEGQNEE